MWSNQRTNQVTGFRFYIRCRTTRETLGTQPGNPQLHHDFIESKNPNLDKVGEEEAALAITLTDETTDEIMEKQMTVFPQARFFFGVDGRIYDPIYDIIPEDLDGEFKVTPFLYDYQMRGSFKESINMLTKASGGKKAVKEDESGAKYDCANISNYKKTVDGNWFVINRKIPMILPETYIDDMGREISTYDENGNLRVLQRPLRAETPKGPRTALASSEIIPAGTEFYFGIQLLNIKDLKACLETLDYKELMGMLQWRGGGKGTFIWTLANKDGVPYEDLTVDQLTAEDKKIIATIDKVLPGCTVVDGFDPDSVELDESPKKRGGGRKKAAESTEETEDAPKKRGRKKKANTEGEEPAPKKRGRKKKSDADDASPEED